MPLTESASRSDRQTDRESEFTASPATLIDLLSDEYAREFLESLRDEAKPARELADEFGVSRPTVYRRLNTLREAGLIAEALEVSTQGHHRRTFRTTVEDIDIELGNGGFEATVTGGDSQPPART